MEPPKRAALEIMYLWQIHNNDMDASQAFDIGDRLKNKITPEDKRHLCW